MKIAIVNDSPMAMEALKRLVCVEAGHEVVWTASNGSEAVDRCSAMTPDVILMDLLMPVMDGAEATRRIMNESPCAILLVTASVERRVSKVFEALGNGALDVVKTPVLNDESGQATGHELLHKLERIGRLIHGGHGERAPAPELEAPLTEPVVPPVVLVGASTGGPKAIASLLSAMPATTRAAVIAVQHIDLQFSEGLADWLNGQSPMPVSSARDGSRLEAGRVYFGAGDGHLIIDADYTLRYIDEPFDTPYRPSIDMLFNSAATLPIAPGAAALLTGMGRDGAAGLLALRRAGWSTMAQDKDSSIVYGMPKAAVELGAVERSLPPEGIGAELARRFAAVSTGKTE